MCQFRNSRDFCETRDVWKICFSHFLRIAKATISMLRFLPCVFARQWRAMWPFPCTNLQCLQPWGRCFQGLLQTSRHFVGGIEMPIPPCHYPFTFFLIFNLEAKSLGDRTWDPNHETAWNWLWDVIDKHLFHALICVTSVGRPVSPGKELWKGWQNVRQNAEHHTWSSEEQIFAMEFLSPRFKTFVFNIFFVVETFG